MAKFEKLFPFLEKQGWAMIEEENGGGSLYVRPTHKVKEFGLLIEHLEEGIDYFMKKKDVETWVNEREDVVYDFAVYQSSNEMSPEEKKNKKKKKTDEFTDKESRALEALVDADKLDQTNNESSSVACRAATPLSRASSANKRMRADDGVHKSSSPSRSPFTPPRHQTNQDRLSTPTRKRPAHRMLAATTESNSTTTTTTTTSKVDPCALGEAESISKASHASEVSSSSETVRIGSDQEAQRPRSRTSRSAPVRKDLVDPKPLTWTDSEIASMLDESSQYLSYYGWNQWLEQTVMSFGGWRALECSSIREGSNDFYRAEAASASGHQFRAQYGRANSHLVQTCIQEAHITRKDRFIDIGSGIGQVVLQVASCVGCPSIGIELLRVRHDTAKKLEGLHRHFAKESKIALGSTSFIYGDFTAPEYHELVSKATIFFVNNAQGTFGARCVKAGTMTLDMQVAALARSMAPGSRIICFDPIYELEIAELSRVFRRRTFRTLPSATDWSTDSLELTLYEKIADKWTCSRCTFANALLNAAGEPVTSCEVCDEDPNGMQRESYVTRRRTVPTPMQDLTGPSVKQRSLTKKNLVKVKKERQSASKPKPQSRPPMPSKIAVIGASMAQCLRTASSSSERSSSPSPLSSPSSAKVGKTYISKKASSTAEPAVIVIDD